MEEINLQEIAEIELRRRAGHEQVDHALGPCRMVQPGRRPPRRSLRCRHDARIQQRRQRKSTQSEIGLLQEHPPRLVTELGSWELGVGS